MDQAKALSPPGLGPGNISLRAKNDPYLYAVVKRKGGRYLPAKSSKSPSSPALMLWKALGSSCGLSICEVHNGCDQFPVVFVSRSVACHLDERPVT